MPTPHLATRPRPPAFGSHGRAILYCRVSTREQAETGHSLEAQQELLRQYAAQKGLQVVAVIAVPESASGQRERVHFADMLQRVKREKIPHILTEKVDRISRNFKEAIRLQDWLEGDASRAVHFVKQSLVIGQHSKSSDTFMWDIFLSMARQYSRNLSEEVRKGQRIATEKGLMPSSRKIGYLGACKHGEQAVGKAKTPDPALVPVIREIFQRLATGHAASDVWRWTRLDGRFKNTHGNPVDHSRFYIFIRDPFVCGQFVFNGQLYEGKHPPIISKALFYDVQDILDGRRNVKVQRHRYLFSGLAVDGDGQRMRCSTAKGHAYYSPRAGGTYTPERVLAAAVTDWFRAISLTDAGLVQLRAAAEQYATNLTIAQKDARHLAIKQLDRLDERAHKARQKLLDGVLTDEDYQRAICDTRLQKKEILKQMPRDEIITEKEVEPMLFVLKALKNMGSLYPRLSFDAKAAITRLFLVELRVDGRRIYLQSKPELEGLLKSAKYISGVLGNPTLRTLSFTSWREWAQHVRHILFTHGALTHACRSEILTTLSSDGTTAHQQKITIPSQGMVIRGVNLHVTMRP